MNQCDGCNSGFPVVNGIHQVPYPSGPMVCTASKYKETRFPNAGVIFTKADLFEAFRHFYGVGLAVPYSEKGLKEQFEEWYNQKVKEKQ